VVLILGILFNGCHERLDGFVQGLTHVSDGWLSGISSILIGLSLMFLCEFDVLSHAVLKGFSILGDKRDDRIRILHLPKVTGIVGVGPTSILAFIRPVLPGQWKRVLATGYRFRDGESNSIPRWFPPAVLSLVMLLEQPPELLQPSQPFEGLILIPSQEELRLCRFLALIPWEPSEIAVNVSLLVSLERLSAIHRMSLLNGSSDVSDCPILSENQKRNQNKSETKTEKNQNLRTFNAK
jgi:hypothetical protein